MIDNSSSTILVSIAFLWSAIEIPSTAVAGELVQYSQSVSRRPRCTPDECYRDPPADRLPEIVTPTHSEKVLDRPVIRWRSVEGVDRYTVTIEGPNFTWEQTTTQLWIRYNDSPLQLGQTYFLTVNAHNGRDPVSRAFTTIDPNQYQEMSDRIAEIEAPEGSLDWVTNVADLYKQYSLLSEAINLLERSLPEPGTSPQLYCTLASLYEQIGEHELEEQVIAESPESHCAIAEHLGHSQDSQPTSH